MGPHLRIVIVVRHLPVIGAVRSIVTAARRAGAASRLAGVVERTQICTITIRIDGNWRQRRMRMLGHQVLRWKVYVVLLMVGHHQIVRFVRAKSTVLVRVLGLDVTRKAAQERVQVERKGRGLSHLLLQPLLGSV